MAKRFTNHARTVAYNFLVERDGERCHLSTNDVLVCLKAPPQYRLEIDHMDGNDGNGHPSNLRLLCVTHNRSSGARGAAATRARKRNGTFQPARIRKSRASSSESGGNSRPAVTTLHTPTREHPYQVPDALPSQPTTSVNDVLDQGHNERPPAKSRPEPVVRKPSGGPEGTPPRDATSARKAEIDYTRGPAQMQANNLYETGFRAWVNIYLNGRDQADMADLQYGGAEAVGCSPQTAREYLLKLTSGPGPLERFRVGNSWGVRRKPRA